MMWLPEGENVLKICLFVLTESTNVKDELVTGQAPGYLAAHRRRQRSPTSRHSDLCHAPHVQHLRRPMLHSCRSTAMELAANQSNTVSQSGTIQAFVKDIRV